MCHATLVRISWCFLHRHILREIWGPKSEEHRDYLRVYFTHLRHKIEPDPTKPTIIKTEPGVGYRLTLPASQSQL
ncbi:MAG: winged helix-turn-helix domain-containing protein [Chthoniobacterales bacterium]